MKVRGAVSSNDGDVVMGWALQGHGIVQRSEWDAAKYLASGQLKEVMPAYKLASADLYVYYVSRRNLPAKIRAFIDFLAADFAR